MLSFIRFVFVGLMGVLGGLFFAQKSGEKFRKEMKTSKKPLQTALTELKEVSMEIKSWAENNDEMKALFEESKVVVKDLVDKAKELGKEASEETAGELEELSKKAKAAAKDLKSKAQTKTKTVKRKFENKLKKEGGSKKSSTK